MNKKANINGITFGVISLVLVILVGIFLFIFYDQVIDQYYIGTLKNVSQEIAASENFNPEFNNTLISLGNAYDARDIPYDLFFLVMVLICLITTSLASIKAKSEGIMSFFGMVFLGSMLAAISMFFIGQFTDYFFTAIFIPVFSDTTLNTPIINWFFNNVNIITFVWFLWLVFLNQFDIQGVVKTASQGLRGGFER